MTHNISIQSILLRHFFGMLLVIIAGLTQSFPLVILSIGVIFTAISGWCPVTAMLKGSAAKH